jgi:NCAIR mutase (PurE)-related protein
MKEKIQEVLRDVQNNTISAETAQDRLFSLLYDDLGYAKVDHLRQYRKGFAEVVFCPSKTPEQVRGIVENMRARGTRNVLLTRADETVYQSVISIDPKADYNKTARTIVCFAEPQEIKGGIILVVCAGTADLPVAEEAAVTAAVMGNHVERLYDVGIAGLHRLLINAHLLREANVVIAVAGMEGALPSVVGGLTDKPVIAVPTSVGYGANFGGLSALLTMLNSCASGVSVVNIDNGFGAGYQAALINNLSKR